MNIALIEAFYSGSHKKWADEFKAHSQHNIDLITLPGKNWKWRMAGGSIKLADKFNASEKEYHLILATSMMDLGLFLSLTRKKSAGIKTAIYFHENQLVYPWSDHDKEKKSGRDRHYAFLNFSSALSADKVFFNSHYHKNSFFEALPKFLSAMPDLKCLNTLDLLIGKSEVLYLGIDLNEKISNAHRKGNKEPVILWNHRWEEDKDPDSFYRILCDLRKAGKKFELILLGERSKEKNISLKKIEHEFQDDIIHNGFAETRSEYETLLSASDVILVTSKQDFFGISIAEAISFGVHPILPDRLSYRELIPKGSYNAVLYKNDKEAINNLTSYVLDLSCQMRSHAHISQFSWNNMISIYDEKLLKLVR